MILYYLLSLEGPRNLKPLTTGEGQERQVLQPPPKRTIWETTRANGTVWDSVREKLKCCPREWSTPAAGLLSRTGPPWGPSRQPCALAARTARLPQVWTGLQPLRCGKRFVSYSSILVRLHLGTASSFEHTNARKRLINWSEFSIVLKLTGVWSTCSVSRNWRKWSCSSGSRRSLREEAPQYL